MKRQKLHQSPLAAALPSNIFPPLTNRNSPLFLGIAWKTSRAMTSPCRQSAGLLGKEETTDNLHETRDDDEPNDDPCDAMCTSFFDVFVNDLELYQSAISMTAMYWDIRTHEITSNGETVIEHLYSWAYLEVFPDSFIEGIERSFRPEQLGCI
jgi:hypothetical protein